jgi:catechol 2,3-dioxygenase-like lactoylglutathione lyase family enzyme
MTGRTRPDVAAPRPRSLHHTAYVTHDTKATVQFYTEILDMPLISAVVDDEIPSTGDPWPYVHLFFELGDGSTIAFFESLGLPGPSPASHPAYEVFNHLALDVGARADVDRWADRLRSRGVEVLGPVDHGIIYSIYFHDPNGIRLELTANTADWKSHAAKARDDVDAWIALQAEAKAAGGDLTAVRDWIRERRRAHKAAPTDPVLT